MTHDVQAKMSSGTRQPVPGSAKRRQRTRKQRDRKIRTGAYSGIDDALYNLGIRLPCELFVCEPGLHREGDVLEPVQEFVLLARANVGVLRGMLMGGPT